MSLNIDNILCEVSKLNSVIFYGQVTAVKGLLIEASGIISGVSVGDFCFIHAKNKIKIPCEVVGFSADKLLLMPFFSLEGIGPGNRLELTDSKALIYPHPSWLGRVIDAMGNPIDGKGPLLNGDLPIPIRNRPPSAHKRQRVKGKVDLGIRAINAFLTICNGQRMGIFAGSGVGKSSIMSMLARHSVVDVAVIGLVGERGREAKEFIEDDLGEEGLSRSVVVVATSDETPLMRRQSAYMAMAVAEYFRDLGHNVLAMMDSITRFAMAQREISLSAGEPPASKGYTPTVFAELPKLLERAGPGETGKGNITGLFTVLVEGDDHNEPVADAVRGILDGHIVLDRAIAERGRYPAINVLKSVSRTLPGCNNDRENNLINKAKAYLAVYEDMAELIRLGAYRKGANPEVDEAIFYYPQIEKFIAQLITEKTDLETCYNMLEQILNSKPGEQPETPENAKDK